ncbi:MAG: hypothetical protein FD123_2419 [Bacteroidetes bacterium]|nr:MAG: hypothetical protein FD123_2419 [Bacteroidota bacterium]
MRVENESMMYVSGKKIFQPLVTNKPPFVSVLPPVVTFRPVISVLADF